MIRIANSADLPSLRALAARANDAPYDLASVLDEKLAPGVDGPATVRVFDEGGNVRGFSVTCGRFLRLIAVDREHRRRGIGRRLVGDARVIGAEPGNYFLPGVLDADAGFFRRLGFREKAVAWNLVAKTDGPAEAGPTFAGPTLAVAPQEVLRFVERHFGRAWAFETSRAAEVFWIPDTGFAAIEANNRGLGTFGPTGVVVAARGQGHGRTLVLAALSALHRRGHGMATIPWTDALDFYRKSCGAEPAHRFVTFGK